MCKRVIATGFALLILTVGFTANVSAQVPFIAVYFDKGLSTETTECGGMFELDELFIGMRNFNAFISAVQFRVVYPTFAVWISDSDKQPVSAGNTRDGFSQGWALPQNGFGAIFVVSALFQWYCDGCEVDNIPILVGPHPLLGPPGAIRFPDEVFIQAVGLTALVCPTIPTEETTWGQVKELYREE